MTIHNTVMMQVAPRALALRLRARSLAHHAAVEQGKAWDRHHQDERSGSSIHAVSPVLMGDGGGAAGAASAAASWARAGSIWARISTASAATTPKRTS